jgi:hypothetical protein
MGYGLQIGEIIEGYTKDEFHIEVIEYARRFGFDPGEEYDFLKIPYSSYTTSSLKQYDIKIKLSSLASEAVEWLNENVSRPEFTYFRFRGRSLYLLPSVDEARESVEFVSSQDEEEPPDDFVGLWLKAGYGKAALYFRDNDGDDYEEWSIE